MFKCRFYQNSWLAKLRIPFLAPIAIPRLLSALLLVLFVSGCDRNSSSSVQMEYGFDDQGRLSYKVAPDKSRVKFQYGEGGNLTNIDYGREEADFGYDESGNLIWAKDETGTTQYYYDAFDRLAGVIWEHSPRRLTLYEYDPWGQMNHIEVYNLERMSKTDNYNTPLSQLEWEKTDRLNLYDERRASFSQLCSSLRQESDEKKAAWREYEIRYSYNLLGDLKYIDTRWGRIDYTYDIPRRTVVRRLPNGIATNYEYSEVGQLTKLRHRDKAGVLIMEYRYDYDGVERLRKIEEFDGHNTRVKELIWNQQGRMSEYHTSDGIVTRYKYNRTGVRVQIGSAHGAIDLSYDEIGDLQKAGDVFLKWDKTGNLKSSKGENGRTMYRYDEKGYVSLAKTPDATVKFRWDAGGNMVSREAKGQTTHYLPNFMSPPGHTLAEYDSKGEITASYVYSEGLIARDDGRGDVRFYLEDGLNTIRQSADQQGRIVNQFEYDPLGRPNVVAGGKLPEFRQAGQRYLPDLGVYSTNRRLYDPELGQFITTEPAPANVDGLAGHRRHIPSPKDNVSLADRGNGTVGGSQFSLKPPQTPAWVWWTKSIYGDVLGMKMAGAWGEKVGGGIGAALDFVDPVSAHLSRLAHGGPFWTWDDTEGYARAILVSWASGEGGIVGKYVAETGAEGAAASGRFLGTRWGRNESFFSWRWWMPLDQYIALREGEAQALIDRHKVDKPGKRAGFELDDIEPPRYWKRRDVYYFRPHDMMFFPPCWPDCGGGGDGRNRQQGIIRNQDGYMDPLIALEKQLGGVELSASANFYGDLGNITGAVYDPVKQCVILTGDRDKRVPAMRSRDFAVALICEYGYGSYPPCNPQFSLDPADSTNPNGDWLKTVYYPEVFLKGTEFGNTMFEADWLLKQYSFGVVVDSNGRVSERVSSVPGFKSKSDLYFEQPFRDTSTVWNRSWIVSDSMVISEHDNSISFDVATMRVLTRKQVPDPTSSTGLRDVESEEDPIATEFARLFTELYDEIAKESPEFERLRQLAKATALVKWLRKNNIPVDLDWAASQLEERLSSVSSVGALSKTRLDTSGVYISILRQFGGVDLTTKPRYNRGGQGAHKIGEHVRSAMASPNAGPVTALEGKEGIATILPITLGGQNAWSATPTIELNQIIYQFNEQGKVAHSIEKNGTKSDYEYDHDGKLIAVNSNDGSGYRVAQSRKGDESVRTIVTPRQASYRFSYATSDGRLQNVKVDGDLWASYKYDTPQNTVIATYADFTESISYDSKGNIRRYKIVDRHTNELEEMSFSRDRSSDLTSVSIDNVPILEPTADQWRSANVSYDAAGRISSVGSEKTGKLIVGYQGNRVSEISIASPDSRAEYRFDDYGITSAVDAFGKTEFVRDHGRLVSVQSPYTGKIEFSSDVDDRLSEVVLPDGSRVDYAYDKQRHSRAPIAYAVTVTRNSRPTLSSSRKKSTSTGPSLMRDVAERVVRRKDNVAAISKMRGGVILDLEVADDGNQCRLDVVESSRGITEADQAAAKEFHKLLRITARVRGKIGKSLQRKWDAFYRDNLVGLGHAKMVTLADGSEVRLKPPLIIRSSEIENGLANIDRIQALSDHFTVIVAARYEFGGKIHETSATQLADKINSMPSLARGNVVFIIRTPDNLKVSQRRRWEDARRALESVIGSDRVVYDPTKTEFQNALADKGSDVIVIELTHTDQGIVLRDDYRYVSEDVRAGQELKHIKSLLAGLGSCDLPAIQDGDLINALLEKGTGLINFRSTTISEDVAYRRLLRLIKLLRDSKGEISIPTLNLPDVIDQLEGIQEPSPAYIGKINDRDRQFGVTCILSNRAA